MDRLLQWEGQGGRDREDGQMTEGIKKETPKIKARLSTSVET